MSLRIKLFFLYCLPAFIAVAIVLSDYRGRVTEVGHSIIEAKCISQKKRSVTEKTVASVTNTPSAQEASARMQASLNTLREYYGQVQCDENNEPIGRSERDTYPELYAKLDEIWRSNAAIVGLMALLPFLLFVSAMLYCGTSDDKIKSAVEAAPRNFFMKFLLAGVMAIGWVYILNPQGRASGTIDYLLNKVSIFNLDTLPIYLKYDTAIEPILAAFLGWYLHMLSYMFTKLVRHDIWSTNVYNHLFKKFTFVYGLAIVVPSVLGDSKVFPSDLEGVNSADILPVVMFLLGFFPLAVFSFVKNRLGSYIGVKDNEGSLRMLPGISHWQVLRLEEEGIETMGDIATLENRPVITKIPTISGLMDHWIDVAQLYVIVGHENYLKMQHRCLTASGFCAAYRRSIIDARKQASNGKETALATKRFDPVAYCESEGLGNADEIAATLHNRFGHLIEPSN